MPNRWQCIRKKGKGFLAKNQWERGVFLKKEGEKDFFPIMKGKGIIFQ